MSESNTSTFTTGPKSNARYDGRILPGIVSVMRAVVDRLRDATADTPVGAVYEQELPSNPAPVYIRVMQRRTVGASTVEPFAARTITLQINAGNVVERGGRSIDRAVLHRKVHETVRTALAGWSPEIDGASATPFAQQSLDEYPFYDNRADAYESFATYTTVIQ